MSNGNHHSDTNLPPAEVNPTTEAMFGPKSQAHYPWKLDGSVTPTSDGHAIYHDESPKGEILDYQNPEETFNRGAYQGMASNPKPREIPKIGKMQIVFDDEALTKKEEEPVDPKLVFFVEGMD